MTKLSGITCTFKFLNCGVFGNAVSPKTKCFVPLSGLHKTANVTCGSRLRGSFSFLKGCFGQN